MRTVLPTMLLAIVAACTKPSAHDARRDPAPAPTVMAAPAAASDADAGAADAQAGSGASADGGLAPLDAPEIEAWQLDDERAYIVAPRGARDKRPVIVGVHGAADRPDRACQKWRETTAGWAFVVCPEGIRVRRNESWGTPELLADRADRAIAALRAKYGAYVADGPVVYGGFSQGGTLAARAIAQRPGVYDTAVLVEVGHTPLSAPRAAAGLEKGKVSRVIVSCATRPCAAFAKRMARAARDHKLAFVLNDGGIGRGHFFDELMFKTLGRTLAQTLHDDDRWAGLAAAVAARWPEENPEVTSR